MYPNIFSIIAYCLFCTISYFNQSSTTFLWLWCKELYCMCYVCICCCFYLLLNFLFFAGSCLIYGGNVCHYLKSCQPMAIVAGKWFAVCTKEYSFLKFLWSLRKGHTSHNTGLYAIRKVPDVHVLCHIMDIGIRKDILLYCVSDDIMIILSSMIVTIERGLTHALDTGDHHLQLKSFCI